MVNIEQHALRAFEQYPRACFADFIQPLPHGLCIFKNERRDFGKVCQQALAVHRRLAKTGAQCVMVGAQTIQLRVKSIQMCQVTHADRAAANLVLISRTNTATGGANLARASGSFAQAIEIAVDRQDQRAIVGEREIFGVDRNALPAQLRHFIAQSPRVKHHAIADNRQCASNDARWQQ